MSAPFTERKIILMMLIVGLLFAGENAMSLEQPNYTVLYSDGNVEYRQYDAYLVSETFIANTESRKAAGNEGFRRLFRYITGANVGGMQVEMTAPVVQTPEQRKGVKIAMTMPVEQVDTKQGWRVAFMLPSKYTLETAPVPTDPRVSISEVPGRLVAVMRFSGRWTDKNFSRRTAELTQALEAADLQMLGDVQSAGYNGPFTPPFLRRNEVMVQVDRLPVGAEAPVNQQYAMQ